MKKEMSLDKFLEGLLVMLITAAIALVGNWITSGFAIQFSKAIPGMLILLVICWVLDVRLMRYRDEVPAEEEEKAEEEKQAQPV